ncbi:squalene--hopene cyclase [Saccharomonospora azurea]|uniref:Squalene-hopene cyclase n=1 Tax=Saccharomonospora azurea NA-128 TaxID=882081 RepID=H8GEE7_9PSEU|nr:squalene--hopene cyclase [Saccharomonospora azurea]EHK80268.1 squalene-hopene cyclase [Saccharomonospora azurea SZMC 14600]EHY87942.1 squalene-hopene cyclase [Saccharomonospora azurea NA-128]
MTDVLTREPAPVVAPSPDRVRRCVDSARDHLLSLQHSQGWWKGELETNVTMEAEDLLLRQFLGISDPRVTEETARWIRSRQREDGTWATFHDGPADVSTTVEAYTALRLAGDPLDAAHLRRAREYILDSGGIEATRVFTRIWLALFGQWSWRELPVLPPELVLLPDWFPLNIYDWACWARQTVVPLTIVGAARPARQLGFSLRELRTGAATRSADSAMSWAGLFHGLDAVLHRLERLPVKPLRATALDRAEKWILDRQEADGGWGGIQPPWVYSILALHLRGYPIDHPVMSKALDGLDGFTIREETADGWVRRLEACQSPVWDTALAMTALLDAGTPDDHPALVSAADWILGEEIRVGGDWQVRRPDLEPSGWAFEFANDCYPDTDDTAEVVLGLRRVRHPEPERVDASVRRATEWLIGMQCSDGGWGAFDADNTRTLCEKLPFCDFGAVIDPPSADVTAHVVEMLAARGLADSEAARRGVRWLLDAQEADGSWFGRWGANHVYGTGAVVPALIACGIPADHEAIRAAVHWLTAHQNEDGGWGEDLRSYVDPSWVGRGASTASQTAWALLALLAAGERGAVVTRGVEWLVETQRPDGGWDQPQYTGTGFPGDFYINYHLYRLVFPITALGRYVESSRDVGPG